MTLISPFSVLLMACSTIPEAASDKYNPDLFLNPEKHVGKHVVLKSFMQYKFENRNLFPSTCSGRKLGTACRSIVISSKDYWVLAVALSFDIILWPVFLLK